MPHIEPLHPADRESLLRAFAGFLHGNCYLFATALHRGLGWPLVGIACADGTIPHAGVRAPDGQLFDLRGYVPDEAFGAPFSLKEPFAICEVPVEKLAALDHDITAEARERGIQTAHTLAEVLWPELPWRESAFAGQLAFARELEALCQRHGYWIGGRDAFITEGGGEQGYRLRPALNPGTLLLERSYDPPACLHTGHVPKLDGAFCPACEQPRVLWPVNPEALEGRRASRA